MLFLVILSNIILLYIYAFILIIILPFLPINNVYHVLQLYLHLVFLTIILYIEFLAISIYIRLELLSFLGSFAFKESLSFCLFIFIGVILFSRLMISLKEVRVYHR
jgi:hypothetical protein